MSCPVPAYPLPLVVRSLAVSSSDGYSVRRKVIYGYRDAVDWLRSVAGGGDDDVDEAGELEVQGELMRVEPSLHRIVAIWSRLSSK
jgi:hypothetical protein